MHYFDWILCSQGHCVCSDASQPIEHVYNQLSLGVQWLQVMSGQYCAVLTAVHPCPTLLLAQALHARALSLQHPLSGQALRFVAPLHEDFQAALQMLGLTLPQGV